MSSDAPRVDRASSLSKAADLRGLYCFLSWGTWERGRSSTEHGNEIWVSWCFIKGWIFCSRLPLLVGNINSESPLKMLKKCMKSCLKLGFVHFYCTVLIQLLKKVLVDKGWRESSYNKKQFLRHCGEIPVKYLLSFFLLPPGRAAAAVPMSCSGSKWFWRLGVLTSSAPSPVLLFLASLTGTEGWWVMQLTMSQVFCAFCIHLQKQDGFWSVWI